MRLTEGLMKWIYTYVLLGATICWGMFTVNTVSTAVSSNEPNPGLVLEVSGASLLLGALIVWNGNVNQHWFRKRGQDELSADCITLNKIKKQKDTDEK
jgi:hypothetical protein